MSAGGRPGRLAPRVTVEFLIPAGGHALRPGREVKVRCGRQGTAATGGLPLVEELAVVLGWAVADAEALLPGISSGGVMRR